LGRVVSFQWSVVSGICVLQRQQQILFENDEKKSKDNGKSNRKNKNKNKNNGTATADPSPSLLSGSG